LSVREDILGFGEGVVGTLASTDPDPSGVFRNPTLAIVGGAPAGLFSFSGNNLMLQGALNYEATPAYNLTVSITDGGGLSSTRNVTVNVDDVNEAAEPYLVDGRWSARSATYYFTPNDPDDASGFVVTGAGSDNGKWQVSAGYDAASNRIWIRAYDPWVDYNQYSYGTLSATVTDRYGGGVSKTFSYYAHVDGPETGPEGHIPPIVIDLDGDGIELVSLAASTIKYDMDRDGLKDRTGWVAADDGFLVLDRNGNGIIDDAGEFSFKNDLTGAVSDLEGLRAFDSNGDGLFGSADRRFAEFRIWQDKNQDGISQATELSTLLERNIRSIRLELDETGAVPDGATDNVIFATSEFTRANGTTGDIGDVFLAFESAADADSKGKLKKGKKVKFAGIDPTQSLPEKLKKKVMQAVLPLGVTTGTSTNAASVSAQAAAASNPASETAPIDLPLSNRNPAAGASQPGGRADNATETPASPSPLPVSGSATGANAGTSQALPAQSLASITAAAPPPATPDAISAAARLLSQPAPVSLNVAQLAPSAQAGGPATTAAPGWSAANPLADTRADRLIAAMAAFQGGEGVGTMSNTALATPATLVAQLAPAI